MNNYDTTEIISLLDADTIGSLLRVYGITYDSVAFRIRQTRQSIVYKQKNDSWKPYERSIVYGLLKENGCNDTLIQIIHIMMQNKKKTGANRDNN